MNELFENDYEFTLPSGLTERVFHSKDRWVVADFQLAPEWS